MEWREDITICDFLMRFSRSVEVFVEVFEEWECMALLQSGILCGSLFYINWYYLEDAR